MNSKLIAEIQALKKIIVSMKEDQKIKNKKVGTFEVLGFGLGAYLEFRN